MGVGRTADQDQIARKTERLCNCVYYGSGGSERAEVSPGDGQCQTWGRVTGKEGGPC